MQRLSSAVGDYRKNVLLRGLGPSLKIAEALNDPFLELRDSNGALIASNNNWRSDQQQQIAATGIPPADDREAAMVATLSEGTFTALLSGTNSSSGIGSVEIYDLDRLGSALRLVNLSTRGYVSSGDGVLIGGLIVNGDAGQKIIVRAIGPDLVGRGVHGALLDPTLELRDASGTLLATNDNWRDSQEQEIKDTTLPPADDRDSAITRTLIPGAYTAIVRGKAGTTGVALIELYDLQPH